MSNALHEDDEWLSRTSRRRGDLDRVAVPFDTNELLRTLAFILENGPERKTTLTMKSVKWMRQLVAIDHANMLVQTRMKADVYSALQTRGFPKAVIDLAVSYGDAYYWHEELLKQLASKLLS